jgi:hypothetical protein
VSNIHCKLDDDITGTLTLGLLQPCHMNPHSKILHHQVPLVLGMADPSQCISLVKLDTWSQLSNIFTNSLMAAFVHLQCSLMGW